MAFTPDYRASVENLLSAVVPITSRAMFGGVGIYGEGLFFALIAEDRLYFKVDDSNRDDFECAGMSPFFPFDSPTPMHYWELPPGVLEKPQELKVWVDKALTVAAKKGKKKS